MKRSLISLAKRVIPYGTLPLGLRKLARRLARVSTPQQVFAPNHSPNTLNCIIAYNSLGGYCTPISSQQRPVTQQILKGRVHEADTIQFIRDNCKEGDVVHAGTYFGDFLPGISKGLVRGAKLWAFEPNLENFRCAQITVLINDLKNIELRNAGLGENRQIKQIQTQTADGVYLGGASKIVNEAEEGNTSDIEIVAIDDVIPADRRVSIIQLDVEGYEQQVLKGAIKTIDRCRPILILENESDNDITKTDWFMEKILGMGYVVSGKVHMNLIIRFANSSLNTTR